MSDKNLSIIDYVFDTKLNKILEKQEMKTDLVLLFIQLGFIYINLQFECGAEFPVFTNVFYGFVIILQQR